MINHCFFWGYPILRPKKGPFYGVETVETTYCTILGKPYRLPQRSGASGGAPDARQGIHGCGVRIFRQRKLTVRNFRQLGIAENFRQLCWVGMWGFIRLPFFGRFLEFEFGKTAPQLVFPNSFSWGSQIKVLVGVAGWLAAVRTPFAVGDAGFIFPVSCLRRLTNMVLQTSFSSYFG